MRGKICIWIMAVVVILAFSHNSSAMGFGNTPGKNKNLNNGTLGNNVQQYGYQEKKWRAPMLPPEQDPTRPKPLPDYTEEPKSKNWHCLCLAPISINDPTPDPSEGRYPITIQDGGKNPNGGTCLTPKGEMGYVRFCTLGD